MPFPLAMLVATLAHATPEPSADPKGSALLAAARAYVARRTYPKLLAFDVAVTLEGDDGRKSTRTYDSAYDGIEDIAYTHAISREEAAHPYVPRGINVVFGNSISMGQGSTTYGTQLNRPGDDPDVLGVPMLSPTYAFGLGRETAESPAATDSTLRVIGEVRVVARDYYAAYLGDATVGGETCAHLRLTPAQHPEQNRLRELWVAQDGAPLQATTHGNFTAKPWDGIDWTIDFQRDGSALYLQSETANQSVRIDRFHRGIVSLRFANIVPSDFRNRFLVSLEPRNAVREPEAGR